MNQMLCWWRRCLYVWVLAGMVIVLALLTVCVTQDGWQSVVGTVECRHAVLAWSEKAHEAAVPAKQCWYVCESGVTHAVASLEDATGAKTYLDIGRDGKARRVYLTASEVASIYYEGFPYPFGGMRRGLAENQGE